MKSASSFNKINEVNEDEYYEESMNNQPAENIFANNLNSTNKSSKVVSKGNKESDLEKLREKIRVQAKRLCDLGDYKTLCESRILQLCPSHPIPVVDSHLRMNTVSIASPTFNNQSQDMGKSKGSLNYNINENQITLLKQKNDDLAYALEIKEREVNTLNKKIELLTHKLNSRITQTFPIESKQVTLPDYPTVDRIPNEKLKESYTNLLFSYRELLNEKELILDSLRQETLNNDEQRSKIEILKQTIESSLFKSYLGPLIQNQKNMHYPKEASMLEVVVDISKLRAKIEELQENLEEIKKENDYLQSINKEMTDRKEKIKDSLERGIRELEEAKERLRQLEQEKDDLNVALYELKEHNNRLEINNEELLKSTGKMFKGPGSLTIDSEYEQQNFLQEKLVEYKKIYEDLSENYEKVMKEKKKIEEDLFTKTQAETTYRELEIDLARVKKERETLNSDVRELEKKKGELEQDNRTITKRLKEISVEFENYKLTSTETYENLLKNITELRNEFKKISDENGELRNIADLAKTEREANERVIMESGRLKAEVENLENQHNLLRSENTALEKDNAKKASDLKIYANENKVFKSENNECREKIKSLKRQVSENLAEIDFLKAKLKERDIFALERENQIRRQENTVQSSENLNLRQQAYDLRTELDAVGSALRTKERLIDDLERDLIKMKNREDDKEVVIQEQKIQIAELKNNIIELNELNKQLEQKKSNVITHAEDLIKRGHEAVKFSEEVDYGKITNAVNANNQFQEFLHNTKLNLNSCISLSKTFINKFESMNIRDLPGLDSNMSKNLLKVDEWIKVVNKELEICYGSMQSLNGPFNDIVLFTSEYNDLIRRVKLKNKQLTSDYKLILDEYENLTKRYERLYSENKNNKQSNKKLVTELLSFKDKVAKEESRIKSHQSNNTFQAQTQLLENRIILVSKQKKSLENLLTYVSKIHTPQDVHKVVSNLLTINEAIYQLEKDKLKLERKLIQATGELRKGKEDYNEDERIAKEREALVFRISEIKKQINEKKDLQSDLELQIFKADKTSNSRLDNKELFDTKRELLETKEEVKKLKQERPYNENIQHKNQVNVNKKAKERDQSLDSLGEEKSRNYKINTGEEELERSRNDYKKYKDYRNNHNSSNMYKDDYYNITNYDELEDKDYHNRSEVLLD